MTDTVIVGAGIIGVSTAYYLSLQNPSSASRIHLIDNSPRLFASASGYAAGFLASDWYSAHVAPLGALSFRLHKELADEHDGRTRWSYSKSTGTSHIPSKKTKKSHDADWLAAGGSRDQAAGEHEFTTGDGPAWLTMQEGDRVEVISEDESVAQVDPLRLCKFLLGESLDRGVRVHQPAEVTGVSVDDGSVLNGVRIKGEDGKEYDVDCKRIVVCAGAWTPDVFAKLFPASKLKVPVLPYAGHSLVVRSPRWTKEHEDAGCHAVFSTDSSGFSPEIFNRIGGEIYIAGLNDAELELPDIATDARSDDESVKKLKKAAVRMLGLPNGEDDLEVVREGLCFRPITIKGPPIVSRVQDEKLGGGMKTLGGGKGGVFLAVGHGPWGISQSLGTGKVLTELIEGLPTSANIKALGI